MPGLAIHQTAGNEVLVVVGNFEFVEVYKEKLLNLLHTIQLHATGASLVGDFMSTAAARTVSKMIAKLRIFTPSTSQLNVTVLLFRLFRTFYSTFLKNVRRKTCTLF